MLKLIDEILTTILSLIACTLTIYVVLGTIALHKREIPQATKIETKH